MHRQREKRPGGRVPLRLGQLRQALQQPVHEQAALEAVAPVHRERRQGRRLGSLGRDGASGFGGLGSDGGGAETQAGSVPDDAHPGDPLVAARRRGLPAAEPQRLARPAVPLADQRAGVERDGIGQPGPAGLAQRMPARRLARRPLVLPAADIEAVLRPGQRDVEQAAVFLQLAAAQRLARAAR